MAAHFVVKEQEALKGGGVFVKLDAGLHEALKIAKNKNAAWPVKLLWYAASARQLMSLGQISDARMEPGPTQQQIIRIDAPVPGEPWNRKQAANNAAKIYGVQTAKLGMLAFG